jgi:peptidase E
MKNIICFGDGGTNAKDPLMDLYVIAQSNKPEPKLCFLHTAGGDDYNYSQYCDRLFSRYPCIPTDLSLFRPKTKDIEDYLLSKDIIYVTGGHSKSMLAVWKDWGVDKILKKAYDQSVLLVGGSAGSVCWFDECITDSIPGALTVMPCLGILPYSNCPHFASKQRQSAYKKFLLAGEIKDGYAIDDYAGIHFQDGAPLRAISSLDGATAFFASNNDGIFELYELDRIDLEDSENQKTFIINTPAFSLGK